MCTFRLKNAKSSNANVCEEFVILRIKRWVNISKKTYEIDIFCRTFYEKLGEILKYDEAIRNKIHLELYSLKDMIK